MKLTSSLCIAILWAALAVLALTNTSADNLQFLDDQAFLMGTAQAVRRGELLLSGLPSHLGARHLGPYYVYLQALLSWMGGSDPVVVSLLFGALKVLAPVVLVAALILTGAPATSGYLAGVWVMLASVSMYTIAILRMDWVNYFLILLSALFTYAVVRVVTRGISALPFFILASTLLIQPHLSPLPILGAAWIGLALYLVMTIRNPPSVGVSQRSLVRCRAVGSACSFVEQGLCVVLTIILWLPPLAYEVLYERNIVAVLGRNIGKRPQGSGLAEIASVFLECIGQVIAGGTGDLSLPLLGVWALMCVALLLHRVKCGTRTEKVCIGIAALQCCAMGIALTQVKPPVHHYYLISVYGPLLFLWGLAAHEGCMRIYYAIRGDYTPTPILCAAVLMLGSFVCVWSKNLVQLPRIVSAQLPEPHLSLEHARDIARMIRSDAPDAARVKIVTRGQVRLSTNAYYYHLSPELLQEFMYAKRMRELPVIQRKLPPYDSGYLIDCGEHKPAHTPRLGRRLQSGWTVGSKVDLSSCRSCEKCRLWRLTATYSN